MFLEASTSDQDIQNRPRHSVYTLSPYCGKTKRGHGTYLGGSLSPHFITSGQCQEFGSGSGRGPHTGPLQQWVAFL